MWRRNSAQWQGSSGCTCACAAAVDAAAVVRCPRVQAAAASAGASAPRPVQLVDIPGHPRLRGQLERHAERAAGVVFVLDSVDFMPKKTETAE